MSLSKKLGARVKASGLSPAAAALKAGITLITFNAVLAGKSVPNARTIPKYAKFLKISTKDMKALAGNRKGRKTKAKRGRKPGKSKR